MPVLAFLVRPGAPVSQQPKEKLVEQVCNKKLLSAVVVNDHMHPRPYIIFDPKGVMKNDIGGDRDTYDHSGTRQFLVALVFASLSHFIS